MAWYTWHGTRGTRHMPPASRASSTAKLDTRRTLTAVFLDAASDLAAASVSAASAASVTAAVSVASVAAASAAFARAAADLDATSAAWRDKRGGVRRGRR